MFSVKIDTNGDYHVRWPTRQSQIVALGVAYVAYENSLPANNRVLAPSLTLVQESLAAAQAEQATAGSSEVSRATASETYRQTLSLAKPKLNMALVQLKAKYISNHAQLEGWGLDTVAGSSGVTVRKPRTEKEWATFLTNYVAQESSLAAANQIADPPLAEMSTLATTLQAANAARKAGSSQRQAAVETRTAAANRLLDLLQTAALVITVTQHNGVVSNHLEQWGFQVVTRTPAPNGDTQPAS